MHHAEILHVQISSSHLLVEIVEPLKNSDAAFHQDLQHYNRRSCRSSVTVLDGNKLSDATSLP